MPESMAVSRAPFKRMISVKIRILLNMIIEEKYIRSLSAAFFRSRNPTPKSIESADVMTTKVKTLGAFVLEANNRDAVVAKMVTPPIKISVIPIASSILSRTIDNNGWPFRLLTAGF